MRETRTYGSEGGESGLTGLPYPYPANTTSWFKRVQLQNAQASGLYRGIRTHSLARRARLRRCAFFENHGFFQVDWRFRKSVQHQ
jgi:hypothetical protein